MIRKLLLGFSTLVSPLIFAQERPEGGEAYGLAGVSAGFQNLSPKLATESSKKGANVLLKAVGSYYFDSFVLDGGLGFRYARLSGSTATITTKSGLFELSPRYRFGDSNFSAGPMLHLLFGTDLTLTETVSDSKNSLALLGLHANMDIPANAMLFRIGAQALRAVTLKNASSWVFLIDFQLSFLGGRQTTNEATPPPAPLPEETEPKELPVETPEPALEPVAEEPLAKVTGEKQVIVRFPADKLLFDTAMSHLRPNVRAYVGQLGAFLNSTSEKWESVEITGHADKRGRDDINLVLSEARAKSVHDALVKGGVAKEKMSFSGKGKREPIDNGASPEALERNRRVELKFENVSDPGDFSRAINEIERPRN